MDESPLYSAELIKVPDELPDVLKQWTKALIRANPDDLVAWSAQYFSTAAKQRAEEIGLDTTMPMEGDEEVATAAAGAAAAATALSSEVESKSS